MTQPSSADATPYDFRKPGRLADDAEDLLTNWQQSLCILAAEKWNQYLPAAVSWQSASIQTEKFGNLLHQLPDPSNVYYLRIGDAADMMLALSRRFALALVSAMLGEQGEEMPEDRALTSIESSLADLAIQEFIAAMNESQPATEPLRGTFDGFDPRPDRTKRFPMNDDVVIVNFQVSSPYGENPLWWVLSEEAVELVLQRIHAQGGSQQGSRAELEKVVREIPVDVVIRLGQATLHVADLANLRAGGRCHAGSARM